MNNNQVLVIGSNATTIVTRAGTGPTGQYLNETYVIPSMALLDAGWRGPPCSRPRQCPLPYIDKASAKPQHFGNDVAAYHRAKAFLCH